MENGFAKFISVIKTAVLAGMGAGVLTREKAEEVVAALVDKGRLTAEEARDLVDRLVEAGNRKKSDVEGSMDKALEDALDSANIARAGDLRGLADRLEKTEQRLTMLEDRLDAGPSSQA